MPVALSVAFDSLSPLLQIVKEVLV
jgi:hypothetical protein